MRILLLITFLMLPACTFHVETRSDKEIADEMMNDQATKAHKNCQNICWPDRAFAYERHGQCICAIEETK